MLPLWIALGSPAAAADGQPGAPSSNPSNRTSNSTVRQLVEEGVKFLENRSYHQAIQSFERAMELQPGLIPAREGLARAHAGLGVELANAGELKASREAFERSLRQSEDDTARFGLGYIDFLEMRDASARDHLERSAAGNPRDARTHKLLSLLDYRKGDTASALVRIRKAVELDPKDAEARAFLAQWEKEGALLKKLGEASTRHFLVRTDPNLHPDAVREILADLEKAYDTIGQALGHWPRARVPVLLLSEADFRDATGSYHWVGGVYDGQIKTPIKPEESAPGRPRPVLGRTLRHEFAHVVVKELSPGCPNWLNEGIAQYFELGGEREANAAALKAQSERVRKLLLENREHRIPFDRIPARLSEVGDPNLARLSYLEGLGFVSYLVEKHRTFRLRLLLASHRREGSLDKAFQATYGDPLARLEDAFWKALEG